MTSSLRNQIEFPCDTIGCKRLRGYRFTNATWCFGVCEPNEFGDRWVECYIRNDSELPPGYENLLDIAIYNDAELDCRMEGLKIQRNYCPLCEREKH